MSFFKHAGRAEKCVECGDSPCSGSACCMYRAFFESGPFMFTLGYQVEDAPDSIIVGPTPSGGVYTGGTTYQKVTGNYPDFNYFYGVSPNLAYTADGTLHGHVDTSLGFPVYFLDAPFVMTNRGESGSGVWEYAYSGDEQFGLSTKINVDPKCQVFDSEGSIASASPLIGIYSDMDGDVTIIDPFSSAYAIDFGGGVFADIFRTSVVPQSCAWSGVTANGSVVTLKWRYAWDQSDRKMWHVAAAFTPTDAATLGVASYAGDKNLAGVYNNVPTGTYDTHTITPTIS